MKKVRISDIGLLPMREVAERAKPLWCVTGNEYLDTFSPAMVLALLDHIDKIEGERNTFWAQANAGWGRAKEEIATNKRLSRRIERLTDGQKG